MKLLFENWRKYLNENQDNQKLGIFVKSSLGDYGTVRIALIDLTRLKSKLMQSQNLDDFLKKVESKAFYNDSVVGYIDASSNKMLSKAPPPGGSGGLCYNTWSNKQTIGKGYGTQLYDALLGWGAANNIYLTADRTWNSGLDTEKGAVGRWKVIDQQTNDEVPPKDGTYTGFFDGGKQTKPIDDDCTVFNSEKGDRSYLNKGYKDESKVKYYNTLKNNFEQFFSSEIETLFDEPGFFGKILGRSPSDRAQKIKNKLLAIGQSKFNEFMSALSELN